MKYYLPTEIFMLKLKYLIAHFLMLIYSHWKTEVKSGAHKNNLAQIINYLITYSRTVYTKVAKNLSHKWKVLIITQICINPILKTIGAISDS